jgi:dTMP kinase
MTKGFLINIEGIDQSGKRTQSHLLSEKLKLEFKRVEHLSFPDYSTIIGGEIQSFLRDERDYNLETFHMLLSINRWEHKEEIEDWLDSGAIVVLNRYSGSNYAYGLAHGLQIDWLLNLEKGLPVPSLTILIDVDPKISINRKISDRDIHEQDQLFLRKVRNEYLRLARDFDWKVLDGDKESLVLHNNIYDIVMDFFRKV